MKVTGTPGNDNERRHELLDAIVNAVHNDDPTFAVELAVGQQLIDPVLMAEHIDVKRRKSKDSTLQTRWAGALATYLTIALEKDLPPEQQDSLRQIRVDLEFDSIIRNKDVGKRPTIILEKQDQAVDIDWRTFQFDATVNPDDYALLQALPAFIDAEAYASGRKSSPYSNRSGIEVALTIVNSKIPIKLVAKALSVLDIYIYRKAEAYITGSLRSQSHTDQNGLEMAAQTIELHGSTPEVQELMRQSLDKYYFKYASAYASGQLPSPRPDQSGLEMADSTIKQFASSHGVAASMKKEFDRYVLENSVACASDACKVDNIRMSVNIIRKHASDPEAERLMRQTIDAHILVLAQKYLDGRLSSPYANVSCEEMAMRAIEFASSPEVKRKMHIILFQ